MKALSLWQPWATLIAIGAKQYETRSWAHSWRGPIVIHAAKSKNGLETMFSTTIFVKTLNTAGYKWIEDLPLGAALCVVDLVDIVKVETIRDVISEQESAFGNYADGRYAWKLANPRRFKAPIPLRGQQGLFDCFVPLRDLVYE